MRVVAVDLEMNQPSTRIIQIGAVCFQPDKGVLVDTFDRFVNPGEPIAPEIQTLTGIGDDNVRNMPTIGETSTEFSAFKQRLHISPIGIVWGAGKSNDIRKNLR